MPKTLEIRRNSSGARRNAARIDFPVWSKYSPLTLALDERAEAVARLEVAAHVDAVLEDVGERPRQLDARPHRERAPRAVLHRVVERGVDRAGDDDRVDRPR